MSHKLIYENCREFPLPPKNPSRQTTSLRHNHPVEQRLMPSQHNWPTNVGAHHGGHGWSACRGRTINQLALSHYSRSPVSVQGYFCAIALGGPSWRCTLGSLPKAKRPPAEANDDDHRRRYNLRINRTQDLAEGERLLPLTYTSV